MHLGLRNRQPGIIKQGCRMYGNSSRNGKYRYDDITLNVLHPCEKTRPPNGISVFMEIFHYFLLGTPVIVLSHATVTCRFHAY